MIVEIEFAEEFEGIHRLIAEAIGRVGLLVSAHILQVSR